MLTYFKRFRRSSLKRPRGFTLIELLVVITIMVVITATILLRQARFDSSTLLRSLSYSIALTIRSAQVYGTSVLGVNNVFAPAYGVYFNNASSYILFADTNNNGAYDSGIDSVVQTYQVGAGFQISKACGNPAVGAQQCWLAAGGGGLSWLVVYFKRPNPDAWFKSSTGAAYSSAYIQIAASNDPTNTHSITVSLTGEIAVGAAGT